VLWPSRWNHAGVLRLVHAAVRVSPQESRMCPSGEPEICHIAGATVVVDNPTSRSELAPTEPHRSVCQDQLLAMILTVASTAPSASQFSNVCQPATSPTMASNCLQRLSAPTCPSTASLLTVFTRGCEPPITVPTWDQISLRSGPRCRWVILAHGHEA
jgi:hypothetical protein